MVFIGTITKMELEHNGTHVSIPASNIPLGDRGLVHIWGRNDMDSAQQMGIGWVIFDPDGVVVEEYNAWEDWPYTGAGNEHHFIGGRFDITKVGTYIISVVLKMSPPPAYPTAVDTYYGTLCIVAAELVAEFSQLSVSRFSKII